MRTIPSIKEYPMRKYMTVVAAFVITTVTIGAVTKFVRNRSESTPTEA